MLLVQVRTLAEALHLHGLQTKWPVLARSFCCHLMLPRRTEDGRTVRDERDWDNRRSVLREFIDLRMQECTDIRGQLCALLGVFRDELNRQLGIENACFNVTIGKVSKDRKLVHVLERVFAPTLDANLFSTGKLFPFYPPGPYLEGVALAEKRTSLAPDLKGNPAIQKHYQEEVTGFILQHPQLAGLAAAQSQFLQRIGASICVPVCDRTKPESIGMLSLVLDRPINPDLVPQNLLRMLERLARAAVVPLRVFTAEKEVVPDSWIDSKADASRQRNLFGDPEYLAALTSGKGSLAAFRHARASELARQVCRLPNVYRVTVRFLDPDGKLSVEGHCGEYDEEWLRRPIQVVGVPADKLCSTAGYAIHTRCDIFLDDTAYLLDVEGRPISHLPVQPRPAAAHAAVLLEFCGQILGVLSVDFDTCFIPPAIRTALHDQASQYALIFKACRIDDEFLQLERGTFSASAFLGHVARMIGAQYGALFERDRHSGLYTLTACVGHTARWQADWPGRYGPGIRAGEGLIGWVLQHDRPLRMANGWDYEELQLAAGAVAPPLWIDRSFSEREFDSGPIAYLGVPISTAEVHGVMRFVNPSNSPGSGFTTYDEQVVKAAAHRLAVKWQQNRSRARIDAVRNLFEVFWKLAPEEGNLQRSLARQVFTVLQGAIGECSCGIRLADEVILPDGTRRPALRRLAHNDPAWAPSHRFTAMIRTPSPCDPFSPGK